MINPETDKVFALQKKREAKNKEKAAEKSAAYSLRKDIESMGVLWYNIYVNYTAQKHWGER